MRIWNLPVTRYQPFADIMERFIRFSLRNAFTRTGYIAKIHTVAVHKLEGMELTTVVNHHPESRQTFAAQFVRQRHRAIN